MNGLATALTLLLMVGLVFGNASAESGLAYATPGSQARIGLELKTMPGLVINRKNPPVLTLPNPFEPGTFLTAEVTGEPWSTDPETYFARLDPVVWTLSVPEDAKPGAYPLTIAVDVSLCDTAVGVCFTEHQEIESTLQVGIVGSDEAAVLVLSTPDF